MVKSVLLIWWSLAFFQSAPVQEKDMEVKLICHFQECALESVSLFEFNGVSFQPLQSKPVEEGTVTFTVKLAGPQFFYVGNAANNVKPVILGVEEEVVLSGDCKRMRSLQFPAEGINQQYGSLTNTLNQHRTKTTQLVQQYRQVYNDENARILVTAELAKLDQSKLELLDAMQKIHPYLAQIAALNTYLSFQNHGADYQNEIEYFVNTYFQYVDWNDKDLEHLPWVFEAFKAYTETLNSIGLQAESHRQFLEASLAQIPKGSRTHQLALGGAIAGLEGKNHPNYVPVAKQFIEQYGSAVPEATQSLERKLQQMQALVIGGEAPDFMQVSPEGKEISLSDLRGQVVLVDFWASWCGPCRRENPHVVELYGKYKEKGFEVLGVSLDNTHDRWVKAIEADSLTWQHVSDLKGWKNEVAQLYGVRSIPHTILLDQEGKIIARNLRGAALTQKLEEVFGE